MEFALLLSIFVISTCGLVYELISSTLASYLLGDSVTQFSTVIGVYLFAMGIGSYLSRYLHKNLIAVFIGVEILIGIIGGCSAALLFGLFEYVASFRLLLYSLIGIIGVLVGLEIPLLLRLLQSRVEFKDLVARIFTFDYVGALIASLLFPLILVPYLGLVKSSFLFGMLNILVALWALYLFRHEIKGAGPSRMAAVIALIGLTFGFIYSEKLTNLAETAQYPDKIIYAKSTSYQRIVLTKTANDLRLYLNGNLQFSSRDEYRYHEALVHPGLQSISQPRKVLVLGGGDGLAVREILKYPSVESVQLVDLDPAMTGLFKRQGILTALNEGSLNSPKVKIIPADAFVWLKENQEVFDFIVVDFPDPSTYSLSKLYTTTFFRLLSRALQPDGVAVVQSTSPLVAPQSYWCIDRTIRTVGLLTTPYHAYIPSFGEWGFIIATHGTFQPPDHFSPQLKFLTAETFHSMLQFSPDMAPRLAEVNTLNNQILVQYFEREWSEYAH